MWWILIGIANLIAGLSGEFVLRGTESSGALVVAAIVMIGIGIFQLVAKAGKKGQEETAAVETAQVESEKQENR